MAQPLVYIVLLNFNGWKDTIECLESVLKLDYKNIRIVIVDNDSKDDSIEYIYKWSKGEILPFKNEEQLLKQLVYPNYKKPINVKTVNSYELQPNVSSNEVILIRSYVNKGFSSGNNIGIKYALSDPSCKYVWLLNNDTVVKPDSLTELVKTFNNDASLGLVGSKLLFYSEPQIIQAIAGLVNKNIGITHHLGEGKNAGFELKENDKYDYLIGASILAGRDFIEDVGLLCEDYFLYNEEPDWCLRGTRKGWRINTCSKSIVYHKHGSSTGSSSKIKSEKIDLINLRSRILFMKRFYPEKMNLVYISFLGIILNRILRFQIKRIPKILKLLIDNR